MGRYVTFRCNISPPTVFLSRVVAAIQPCTEAAKTSLCRNLCRLALSRCRNRIPQRHRRKALAHHQRFMMPLDAPMAARPPHAAPALNHPVSACHDAAVQSHRPESGQVLGRRACRAPRAGRSAGSPPRAGRSECLVRHRPRSRAPHARSFPAPGRSGCRLERPWL